MLEANALFPGKKFSVKADVTWAFDGDLETSPNVYHGTTNPVVGVSLPAPAHLACVFVNADCQNSTRASRMTRLALYGAESITSLNGGEYVQLAAPITTYQQSDDRQWFRYNSTDTNSLFACLFGYAPGNDATSGQWCGHAREIRFVGWTEADAIASGKVLAPEGVSAAYGNGVVTVSWTAAVNASSLSIERRQQEDGDWTVVATDVDPSALSYVDGNGLRGGHAYYYRVRSTGLGGLMSAETEPVSVLIPKKGFVISFM